ncbi:PIN domain-containing protein [Candidatus Woesebacteria bacterium]|nr:PIN domain-containing protein [Candidatus Woesebacteria bacterium]
MMVVLDTSSLIRFFTNDIPEKALRIKEILDKENKIYIPQVVFPELEYVLLGKTYRSDRKKVLLAFQFLISRKNITVEREVSVAVSIYEKSKLDIADCIVVAYHQKGKLISFDEELVKCVRKLSKKESPKR